MNYVDSTMLRVGYQVQKIKYKMEVSVKRQIRIEIEVEDKAH